MQPHFFWKYILLLFFSLFSPSAFSSSFFAFLVFFLPLVLLPFCSDFLSQYVSSFLSFCSSYVSSPLTVFAWCFFFFASVSFKLFFLPFLRVFSIFLFVPIFCYCSSPLHFIFQDWQGHHGHKFVLFSGRLFAPLFPLLIPVPFSLSLLPCRAFLFQDWQGAVTVFWHFVASILALWGQLFAFCGAMFCMLFRMLKHVCAVCLASGVSILTLQWLHFDPLLGQFCHRFVVNLHFLLHLAWCILCFLVLNAGLLVDQFRAFRRSIVTLVEAHV